MHYEQLRTRVKTGDVFMTSGRGIVSLIIRIGSGEKFSHVGMFFWMGENLLTAEFLEGAGFRIRRASDRIADSLKKGEVYYGAAPDSVRAKPSELVDAVWSFRNRNYGYLSLVKVWVAQILKKNITGDQVVCSTAVQKWWEATGYEFTATPDPGNYIALCENGTFPLQKSPPPAPPKQPDEMGP